MAEQAKTTPSAQDPSYAPPTLVSYPHQAYNGAPFPPPGPPGTYMPQLFAYPPPPDGSDAEGQNGSVQAPPYMMPLPGVFYAYPSHPQAPGVGPPPTNPSPPASTRPKRKQVKMACTNCASACKRCDENRPCERCVKYGTAETCMDGIRKERKKGIKRGPYKRKTKDGSEGASFNAEWPNGQPPSSVTTAAGIHAAAPYLPEGYYPIYYPPPGAFLSHPQDGQPGTDGVPPPANGQPMVPYVIHPGAYPPFPHYPQLYPHQAPPPGAGPQPQSVSSQSVSAPPATTVQQQPDIPQPATINPADATTKTSDSAPSIGGAEGTVVDPAVAGTNSKKRSKGAKSGEPKAKRVKANGPPRDERSKETETSTSTVRPSAEVNKDK